MKTKLPVEGPDDSVVVPLRFAPVEDLAPGSIWIVTVPPTSMVIRP
jgi:hypothetical protein